MFGLFLKRLVIDTSAEEIGRTTTILEQNGIKYEVRTIRSRGTIGSGIDAHAYARANLALYKGAQQPSFVYYVYVRRKDYDRARRLISAQED